MNSRQLRSGTIVASLGLAAAGVCLAAGPMAGGDAMLAVEVSGFAVLSIWVLVVVRDVLRGRRLAQALDRRSTRGAPAGMPCRIVRGGGRRALVLGVIRPTIYIGDELVAALDGDELQAVLLHEEHHRRTLAPLRAASLEAWLTLLGRMVPVRTVLLDRLTVLEEEADAAALRRGVDPGALASALLKSDPQLALGMSFTAASARRLRTLVAQADGTSQLEHPPLPYEWLPVAAIAVVTLACHLGGLPPFS